MKVFDLQKNKINKKETKFYNFEEDKLILGIVFMDNNVQDLHNVASNQCFKCLFENQEKTTEAEHQEQNWIAIAYQHNKMSEHVHMTLRNCNDPEKNVSNGNYRFIQKYEKKQIGIGLGKWNIKSDIGTASYLALGNRKKNSEFDQKINVVEVIKVTQEKVDSFTLKVKDQNLIKTQFYEFFENYLHQIYRIDKMNKPNSDEKDYFALKTIQIHNDTIQSAFNDELGIEGGFKEECYNILNFKENYSTIIQLVQSQGTKKQTVYRKSKDDLNNPIRVAKHWDQCKDGLAKSYFQNNKGIMQLHPGFDNIFIDSFKNLQVGDQKLKDNQTFEDFEYLEGMDSGNCAKRVNSSIDIYQNKQRLTSKRKCLNGHEMDHLKIKDKPKNMQDKVLECDNSDCIDKLIVVKDKAGRNEQMYYRCNVADCQQNFHYNHAKEIEAKSQFRNFGTKKKENEYQDKSRTIKFSNDDRKCFPRLVFDETNNQIQIEVVFDKPEMISGKNSSGMLEYVVDLKDRHGVEQIEVVDVSDDIKNAPQRTVLSASSVIQSGSQTDQLYRQNFQVALMDKSGMWVKIKEYSLEWHECKNCDPNKVKLDFVGMKLLFFRRPLDRSEQTKTLNFLPYCPKDNYIIQGTQIIPSPNEEKQGDHIILENFKQKDFQFVGDLFASGYKIYVEDGNHTRQKYILFESQFRESVWNPGLNKRPVTKDYEFDSMDVNVLLEQQIIVMMNMVPLRDVLSGENFLQEDHDDFLAPLEVLKGSCLCTLELNSKTFIKNRQVDAQNQIKKLLGHDMAKSLLGELDHVEINKKQQLRKSILENFLMKYDCPCDKQERITSLLNSFPRDQGWKRQMFEVSQDLHFLNPVIRGFSDQVWNKKLLNQELGRTVNQLKSKEERKEIEDIWTKNQNIVILNARELIEKFLLKREHAQRSNQSYQILQCIMNHALTKSKEDHDMSIFTQFFFDEGQDNNMYSFARILDDPQLPKDMIGAPFLHPYSDKIPNSDRKKAVERYICEDKIFKQQQVDALDLNEPMQPVKNYLIDFKSILINTKLKAHYKSIAPTVKDKSYYVYNKKQKPVKEERTKFTEFHLADLVMKINDNYSDDIEKQGCIKSIIDYQNNEKTQKFFKKQGLFFILCCMLPFMGGLLIQEETKFQRLVLNFMFSCSIVVQIYIESIQYRSEVRDKQKYFKDGYNIYDVVMICLMIVLSVSRFIDPTNWLPGKYLQASMGEHGITELKLLLMMLLNSVLFCCFFMKCFFYLRVFPEFGLLVELIYGIRRKLMPFLLFLFLFVIFFTVVFLILGCNYGEVDMLNDEFYLFIQVFQMVTASINNPSHEFWNHYGLLYPDSHIPLVVIYLIWFFWLVFQLLISIILLNFLIGLITQAYEEVMSQAEITQYKHKAQLNRECYQFYHWFGKLDEIDCFILQAVDDVKEDSNWKGFTQTMGKTMKRENASLVANVNTRMTEQYTRFEESQKLLKEDHQKQLEGLKKAVVDQLKKSQATKKITDQMPKVLKGLLKQQAAGLVVEEAGQKLKDKVQDKAWGFEKNDQ